jgi:hypothetical protein
MGLLGWMLSSDDAVDLQREADQEHMLSLKEDSEWERLDQFKHGAIDRHGFEVDEDTDPADLYHASDEE